MLVFRPLGSYGWYRPWFSALWAKKKLAFERSRSVTYNYDDDNQNMVAFSTHEVLFVNEGPVSKTTRYYNKMSNKEI